MMNSSSNTCNNESKRSGRGAIAQEKGSTQAPQSTKNSKTENGGKFASVFSKGEIRAGASDLYSQNDTIIIDLKQQAQRHPEKSLSIISLAGLDNSNPALSSICTFGPSDETPLQQRFTLGNGQNQIQNLNTIEELKERRISDFSSEGTISSHQMQTSSQLSRETSQDPLGNAMHALATSYHTGVQVSRDHQQQVLGLSQPQQNQIPSQASFNDDLAYPNPFPQAPPLIVAQIMGTTTRDKASHFNIFSNSFDETGALQLEMRPQRNCKSSTRKMNQTQKQKQSGINKVIQQQVPIPLLQNLGGIQINAQIPQGQLTGKLNSGSLNRTSYHTEGVNNNYGVGLLGTKQQKVQHNQSMQVPAPHFHSSSQTQQINSNSPVDLSSRSMIASPYQLGFIAQKEAVAYALGAANQSMQMPNPQAIFIGMSSGDSIAAVSGGGQGKRKQSMVNTSINTHNMDPQTYYRWKQQKYKTSRSNAGTALAQQQVNSGAYRQKTETNQKEEEGQRQIGGGSNSNIMNNSQQMVFNQQNQIGGAQKQIQNQIIRNKGNQTQKNNKSSRRSVGYRSIMNTSSTGVTGIHGGQFLKSLTDATNPQQHISLRFSDRNVQELTGLHLFKNLNELDISGNHLIAEIVELKSLQFLKKLNIANNQITVLYPLPSNLEILNLSYNKLKSLSPTVTKSLKNLTTLDLSYNGLEGLDGIQYMTRLKRLLSKNNQVQELEPLNSLQTLVEIDLENNPVDNYVKLLEMLKNKPDILVVNLKLSPVFLTIQNFEQLYHELETSLMMEGKLNNETSETKKAINQQKPSILENFKKHLQHFSGGCLYRSKRAYHKLRALQQHSKRSSSNFSNGSSSCSRAPGSAVHTGGRASNPVVGGNASIGNSFSPLLNSNQPMNTPNSSNIINQQAHNYSHRLEDIQKIYDEILNEEEEHERKLMRIQRRKMKRMGIYDPNQDDDSAGDDEDYEESISMYEEEEMDEEMMDPAMSFEEDIEDLQSYRNQAQAPNNNDFLNESTADFNKEIRQIHQELKDEYGQDLLIPSQTSGNIPEHLQSFQSSQSNAKGNKKKQKNSSESSNVNTLKKNPPISFKLDLSKCTNQQSEDDDEEENLGSKQIGNELDSMSGEIPGLQNIKVTDDSFRQFQQKFQQTVSSVSQEAKIIGQQEQSQKNTIRGNQQVNDMPPRPLPQKQIVIPKLQLGALQQHNQQHSIPLKQALIQTNGQIKQIIAQQQQNSLRQAQQQTLQSSQSIHQSENQRDNPQKEDCCNESCLHYKLKFRDLRMKYEDEKQSNLKEIALLKGLLIEIKDIFKYSARGDIMNLPQFLRAYRTSSKDECDKASKDIEVLKAKCLELSNWKKEQEDRAIKKNYDLEIKCQENEKTISDLKDQLKNILTQRNPSCINKSHEYGNLMSELEDISKLDETSLMHQPSIPEIKRTLSTKYQHSQVNNLFTNPSYFYNSSSHQILSGNDAESSINREAEDETQLFQPTKKLNNAQQLPGGPITITQRKKSINHQELKKIKRPQSVVAGISQRRSSQGIKINNVLKIEANENKNKVTSNMNLTRDDQSIGANEYCSNHELIMPALDFSSINALQGGGEQSQTPLSQTMNRKVGHYLQRLKERNSSLQERLNGSFRDNSGTHSMLNIVSSPTPQGEVQMVNLNQIHYQQDSITLNPYILSPNNHRYNDSINSAKPNLHPTFQLSQKNANGTNLPISHTQYQSQQVSTNNLHQPQSSIYQNQGPSLLKKITYKDPQSSRIQSHFVVPSSRTGGQEQFSNNDQETEYGKIKEDQPPAATSSGNKQGSQSAGVKQHSKTQRIHVNRIQYTKGASGGGGGRGQSSSGFNSSLSKQADVNTGGYQTQQQATVNLTQLFSGRLQRNDSQENPQMAVIRQAANYQTQQYPK